MSLQGPTAKFWGSQLVMLHSFLLSRLRGSNSRERWAIAICRSGPRSKHGTVEPSGAARSEDTRLGMLLRITWAGWRGYLSFASLH